MKRPPGSNSRTTTRSRPEPFELTKTIKGDVTPEEAAGLLTFEVKTTVTENGEEVDKWVGPDGELTDTATKLTLEKDFTFDEETGKYTLIINNVEVGEYTITETDKDADGNDVTVTYSINGGDSQTGDTSTAATARPATPPRLKSRTARSQRSISRTTTRSTPEPLN